MRNKGVEIGLIAFLAVALVLAVLGLLVPSRDLEFRLASLALAVAAIGLGTTSFYLARHTDSVARHIDETAAEANAKIQGVANLLLERLDTLDKRLQRPDE